MFSFRLTRRVRFPSHWPDVIADYLRPKQGLSRTPYAFESLSSGSHSFVATEDLYVGPEQWSQVYSGSLSSPVFGQQHNLVLKVFDPDFFPFDPDDPLRFNLDVPLPRPDSCYRFVDELMAWTEVYSYSKLNSLQGTTIPHLIGAFMVRSPDSDQERFGIAMSRIHGRPIDEVCRELGSELDGETDWYPIALELVRRVYDIHQLGIIGFDIRVENILVGDDQKPGCSRPDIKLFDFAVARPNDFDTAEDMKKYNVRQHTKLDIVALNRVLLDVCGAGWGRSRYLREHGLSGDYIGRRYKFWDWAHREYPNDAWVSSWWDKYAADLWPAKRTPVDDDE